MTSEARQALEAAGIRTGELLDRMMGSESMAERFLCRFLEDPTSAALEAAMAAGRREEAFRAAHTLKGLCGNLSITGLGALAGRQTELLRGAEGWAEAQALMPEIAEAYSRVRSAIAGHLA